MDWFEVELRLPHEMKEPVMNRLFEMGAEGLAEADEEAGAVVRGYFGADRRALVDRDLPGYLHSVRECLPGSEAARWVINGVGAADWADKYKEFYFAQPLSSHFFLRPAWDVRTPIPEGMIPIVMEPGQAFGTGLHATTRLCIALLEHSVELFVRPETLRVVDVGTGTGILAMVASKLGVAAVDAVDTDPVAVEVANANFALNGCVNLNATVGSLEDLAGRYDLIVSNILLETHLRLAPLYRSRLADRGLVVISGLLAPQKPAIVEAFAANGLVEEESQTTQEWLAITFRASRDV